MRDSISRFRSACRARARGAALAALGATVAPAAGAEALRDAIELGGARVTVVRADGAQECAGAREIGERLKPLLAPGATGTPLDIELSIEHTGDEWIGDVVVRGSTEGLRRLRAPGPRCEELERRLIALLAIVLDRPGAGEDTVAPAPEPAASAAAPQPAAPKPTPPVDARPPVPVVAKAAPGVEPGADRGREPRRERHAEPSSVSAFVSGGAGLTAAVAGNPLTWAFAGFGLEQAWWRLLFTGFATPDSTEEFAGGGVDVRWSGGMVRPCVRMLGAGSLRAFGCGAVMVATLRGEAHDYRVVENAEYRPYYAAGAGGIGVMGLDSSLTVSAEATVLAPLVRESFSIRSAGAAYETPRVGTWFGAALGARIW